MKLKKMGIVALALSLSITQLPTTAWAAESNAAKEKIESFAKEKAKSIKDQKKYVEGEAIVLLSSTYTRNAAKNALKATGLSSKYTVKNMWDFSNKDGKVNLKGNSGIKFGDYVVAVVKSDTLSTKNLIKELKKLDNVEKAEPNYIVHATEIPDYSDYQWALDNKGQNGGTAGKDINADKIWEQDVKGTDKVIAIIDTGFDYTNEDLKDAAWTNPKQGKLAGIHGYDFVNFDADPMDDNGHGTHCSGIMAAATESTKLGISGVNQKAKIMGLKFLDEEGSGSTDAAIAAYNYIYQAQSLGVDVVAVNNSWGEVESSIFNDICIKVGERGAVSCFAAGNDGTNNDEHYDIIGSEENPYIITVAATNEKDELADFSEYGKKTVTLGAPGADILSTVSYDCFNPTLYTDELKTTLCGTNSNDYNAATVDAYTVLTDGDKATGTLGEESQTGAYSATQSEYGIPTYMVACNAKGAVNPASTISVSADSATYFGNEAGKSLKVSANAKKGDMVTFVIPISDGASDVDKTFSSMLKFKAPNATEKQIFWGEEIPITSIVLFDFLGEADVKTLAKTNFLDFDSYYGMDLDGENNYWTHINENVSKESEKKYLVAQFVCNYDGEYVAYLEDIATTKGVTNEAKKFGRYDFYNGTSMATPYVTGSVALLSGLYPEATASELVAIASGSVRQSASLSGKTVTGGVLDLAYANDPAPFISTIYVAKDATVSVSGVGFKEGTTVKLNGKATTDFIIDEGKYITINCNDYVNKKVEVEISTDRGKVSKSCFVATGNEYNLACSDDEEGAELVLDKKSQVVTDGKQMYVVEEGYETINVYKIKTTGNEEEGYTVAGNVECNFYLADCFDPIDTSENTGRIDVLDGLVLRGDDIYMIAAAVDDITGYTDAKLIKANIETGKVTVLSELPEVYDNTSIGTLTSYNGELLLIGGFDYSTNSFATTVQKYNVETDTWSDGVVLPEGRDGGKCVQVGEKLVYTLGNAFENEDKEYVCPKNLIFDGTSWTTSGADPVGFICQDEFTYSNGKKVAKFVSNVGVCKEGILYAGTIAEGLGDTFTYDLTTDSYATTGYQYSVDTELNNLMGTVVNNKFVGYTAYDSTPDFDYDDWSLTKSGKHELTKESKEGTYGNFYVIPVKSGLISVKAETAKNGKIKLSTTKAMPGAYVTAKAVGNKGYLPTYISVNGTKTNAGEVSFIVNRATTVKAGFGLAVTKITLNKKNLNLKAGKKFVLKATVYPKKAVNRVVKFKSSNTKYATVSASGVITAKKAGIGKTVTITVTAADGSKVTAKCKIKITK